MKCNDSTIAVADEREVDDQINDTDEEEDENQGDDSNKAISVEKSLDINWQESSVYAGAAERQFSIAQGTNQSSLCSPAQDDTQQSLNASAATVEQWYKEV